MSKISQLGKFFTEFYKNESGGTAVEYAMIIGFIGLALVPALKLIAENTNDNHECLADLFNNGVGDGSGQDCAS